MTSLFGNTGAVRRLGVLLFVLLLPAAVRCGGADTALPAGSGAASSGGNPDASTKGGSSMGGGASMPGDDAGADSGPAFMPPATASGNTASDGGPTADAVMVVSPMTPGPIGPYADSDASSAGTEASARDGAPLDAAFADESTPPDALPAGSEPDAADGGCVPESLAKTCSATACGKTKNSCGRTVTCPDTCKAPNTCGGGVAGANQCGCSGLAGQACCAGRTCAAGNACVNGSVCAACGARGEACCTTAAACATGLSCFGGTCGACSSADVPIPSTCTSVPITRAFASMTSALSSPRLAIDGNRCTAWNSGQPPTQFWGGDFACTGISCPNVTRVGFVTAMSTPGMVTLEIEAIVPGGTNVDVFGPATVAMVDDKYYEFPVALPAIPSSGSSPISLEIKVTASPSSVALREVVFLSCN